MTALKGSDKIKCMQEKGKWSWWGWSQSVLTQAESKQRSRDYSHSSTDKKKHCVSLWTVRDETAGDQGLAVSGAAIATIHLVHQPTGSQGTQIFDCAWFWGFYEMSSNGMSTWIGRLDNAQGPSDGKWPHPISWRSTTEKKKAAPPRVRQNPPAWRPSNWDTGMSALPGSTAASSLRTGTWTLQTFQPSPSSHESIPHNKCLCE